MFSGRIILTSVLQGSSTNWEGWTLMACLPGKWLKKHKRYSVHLLWSSLHRSQHASHQIVSNILQKFLLMEPKWQEITSSSAHYLSISPAAAWWSHGLWLTNLAIWQHHSTISQSYKKIWAKLFFLSQSQRLFCWPGASLWLTWRNRLTPDKLGNICFTWHLVCMH